MNLLELNIWDNGFNGYLRQAFIQYPINVEVNNNKELTNIVFSSFKIDEDIIGTINECVYNFANGDKSKKLNCVSKILKFIGSPVLSFFVWNKLISYGVKVWTPDSTELILKQYFKAMDSSQLNKFIIATPLYMINYNDYNNEKRFITGDYPEKQFYYLTLFEMVTNMISSKIAFDESHINAERRYKKGSKEYIEELEINSRLYGWTANFDYCYDDMNTLREYSHGKIFTRPIVYI